MKPQPTGFLRLPTPQQIDPRHNKRPKPRPLSHTLLQSTTSNHDTDTTQTPTPPETT